MDEEVTPQEDLPPEINPPVDPDAEGLQALEEAADHSLVDQHGPGVVSHHNYAAMKEDAMRQINEAAVKNDMPPETKPKEA